MYETIFILNPNLVENEIKSIIEKATKLIEKDDGKIIEVQDWGKKPLAYEIEKFSNGHYIFINYNGNGKIVFELERILRLDEKVIKYMTIRQEDQS